MISILILSWNTRELLRACLASVREHCAGLEHEVIVLDNASADGSAAMVREEFPGVRLLEESSNLGFAAGNNRAYEVASGEWIWLLNSDTEIHAGAAEALVEFLEAHERCGGVASALIDARDGSIQRSCRTFPTPAALWSEATGLAKFFSRSRRYGFYRMGYWNMRDARKVEQPMASSFMLRREAIASITSELSGPDRHLFDERFPIFFNDVDLCWRLWRAGWEVWFEPASRVRHWGGASTGQARPEMIRESHRALLAFYDKHWRQSYRPAVLAATRALVRISGAWRVWRARKAQMKQEAEKNGFSPR